MTPDPFTADGHQHDPATGWTGVEEDPDGIWWVTVTDDTGTTTAGPYLDEVQALRALNTWEHRDLSL